MKWLHTKYWRNKYKNGSHYVSYSNDDGEIGASEKIIELINMHKLENISIVVLRWYGNLHLQQRRVDLII